MRSDEVRVINGPVTATRPWLGLLIAASVTVLAWAPYVVGPSVDDTEIGILIAIVLIGLISGLMVARRPDHPISWLLAVAALSGGVAGAAVGLLPTGITELSWWQATLAIVSGPAWYTILLIVVVWIPLLFPTGMLPSRRWRWAAWLLGAGVVFFSVLWMVQEEFCTGWDDSDNCVSSVPNPMGISGLTNPEESGIGTILYAVLLIGALSALTSLVIRFRRSGPVERQQVKWVAFSIGLFIGSTVLIEMVWMDLMAQAEPPVYDLAQQLLWVMIPASIAVAIFRYKLYEIDRIVSRTITYSVIAIVLGAVYAAGIIGLQALLPDSDDLAVAASTLVAAALFSPVQQRVRSWMDRRFNRRRYDAQQLVDAFSIRLRDTIDLNTMSGELQTLVTQTVEPVSVSVWLKGEESR